MISTYRRGEADILALAIQSQQEALIHAMASTTHAPPDYCRTQVQRMSTAYLRVASGDVLISTNDN